MNFPYKVDMSLGRLWLIALYASVLIGQRDCLVLALQHLVESRSIDIVKSVK